MTDMNEATAHGVRELKALLSAALIIAQARERTREHELRQQEREMAERERQAWRGAHHDPAASPTGPDPNGLLTQPDPARQERELEAIRASATRTSNVTAEHDDEYAAAAASPTHSTQTPASQLDLAEKWANAHVDPDAGPRYRAELDNQVRAQGVDPAEILLPPREGQQSSGQYFTPTVIDPEQVRQDADIRAGELERDPDARRLARSKPFKRTAAKYRRPSTPTGPGRAVGQRRSSRARPTAPTPHRRSPPAWGPAANSPSPTGTRPAPRAGNAETAQSPLIAGPRRLGRLRHACTSPPPVHCISMQSGDPRRVPPEVGHHTPFDFPCATSTSESTTARTQGSSTGAPSRNAATSSDGLGRRSCPEPARPRDGPE